MVAVVATAVRKRMKSEWAKAKMRAAWPVCAVPNCPGCKVLKELFADVSPPPDPTAERYP